MRFRFQRTAFNYISFKGTHRLYNDAPEASTFVIVAKGISF